MVTFIILGICLLGIPVLTLRAIYSKKCKDTEQEAEQFEREIALYRAHFYKYKNADNPFLATHKKNAST